MGEFVHLHLHSEFSLLDGLNRIKQIPKTIKEKGMDAVAITDHGNMFGAVDFYKECKKNGVKAIIGVEMYLAKRRMQDKEPKIDDVRYHLILLAKNEEGYKNLVKLVSIANTEGMYYKPRIDKETLKKYSSGIICLSGCLSGEVSKTILEDYEKAKEIASWYKDVFKDDYYIEIQGNGIKEQKLVNQKLIKLANELQIELVATNDTHYTEKGGDQDQDILICIQTGKKINDEDRMKIDTDQLYIKSAEEMEKEFGDIPGAIENTVKIAEKCNFEFKFGETKLPNFETPNGEKHEQYLQRQVLEGLSLRYGIQYREEDIVENYDEKQRKIIERTNYELSVIVKMGYTDYFLIVWDFIRYAKSKQIPVGPGRGSGAGSIVAYLLGITDIDPMKYGLMFERFLNPDRISMPDFDIDFCNERREEVIKYVEDKYGKDHVAQIITFGTMSARMVIRDVARVLDLPYSLADKIAKLIPMQIGMTIEKALEVSSELRDIYEKDETVKKLINQAIRLEGMPRNASTHACGVVITKNPVSDYVPLYVNDGNVVTQYTMNLLEEIGLLKMDFLGLRTLTLINECEKMVRKTRQEEVEYAKEMDDPKVFELWKKGKTLGVFQFESPGMIRFMKELKPDNIEDIIAGVSLYRPGPMDQIPRYIMGKRNPGHNEYTHKSLENILDVTYGCMVYQEQVMQIVRDLAGYTLGRADLIRRAMGKKKLDVMEKEREIFINGLVENDEIIVPGCIRNGIEKDSANKIFDEMSEFAKYAFNKSHAAAYAVLSYKTAHLKTYYPEEMLASTMNSYLGNLDKIPKYIEDAKSMGIEVKKPDVNQSFIKFSVVPGKNTIRFGLGSIKNIGIGVAEAIVEERKKAGVYKSFEEFVERTKGKGINKKAIESLIRAGALDELGKDRAVLLESYEEILSYYTKEESTIFDGQASMFDEIEVKKDGVEHLYVNVEKMSEQEKLSNEKEMIGIYVSGHPLTNIYPRLKNTVDFDSRDIIQENIREGKEIKTAGLVSSVKVKNTKKGTTICFVEVEDIYGTMQMMLFEKTYMEYKDRIKEGAIIGIYARLSVKEDEVLLIPNKIIDLTDKL